MSQPVCPWWVGFLLVSPLRKLFQHPKRILEPYVKEGIVALDVGCAMGYFTLPMAKLVGAQGRVVAVDLQEKMIGSLKRRALKADLLERIEPRICSSASLEIDDLSGTVDFALAFAVLHEMPDVRSTLTSVAQALKSGSLLLMAEPRGHVSRQEFGGTVAVARACGLEVIGEPTISRSHAALLRKHLGC